DNLLNQKSAKVFLRDDTKRSLIYTPDASRAMALIGNTPDAYGQTWHLPCDDRRLTYREFIAVAAKVFNVQPKYKVIKRWQLRLAGRFNQTIRDAAELLPRYESDNLFVSDKFQTRFPDFQITTFEQGLTTIQQEKANDQKPL
ncbi:NAD-dependent epimerase, partial [Vibrio sp. 1262-1]|nr:NAD-dependent epimerase [Vibrio sp. 1262-1]